MAVGGKGPYVMAFSQGLMLAGLAASPWQAPFKGMNQNGHLRAIDKGS